MTKELKGSSAIQQDKIQQAEEIIAAVGDNFTAGKRGTASYLKNMANDPLSYSRHLDHIQKMTGGFVGFNPRGSEQYSKILELFNQGNRSSFAQTGIPGGGQVQALVDLPLTDISNGYFNDDYIGNRILTDSPVMMRTGLLGSYGNNHNVALDKNSVLAEGASTVQQVNTRDMSFENYHVRTFALQDIITPDDRMNTNKPFQAEEDITISLKQLLMLCCEIDIANQINDAANYPAANVETLGSADQKFNDYENSNIHEVVQKMRNAIITACGKAPNTVVMDKLTKETLGRHPQVLGQIFGTLSTDRTANEEQIAKIFDVDRIMIGMTARSATADKGAALSRVWGKDIWLGHVANAKSLRQKSFGYYHHFDTSDAFTVSYTHLTLPTKA